MKPVVVHERTYLWTAAFLLILCAGASILLSRYSLIFLGLFLAAVFGALGTQKTIFSEAGIESRFLFWIDVIAWDQVIQAGITKVADHGSHGPYLLLTFAGGSPKTSAMGFSDWKNRNGGTCLYAPASEELRRLVSVCYGPLDFDLS